MKPPAISEQYVRVPNFQTVYANQVRVSISPWDTQFIFIRLEAEGRPNEELIGVHMAPGQLKVLADVLTKAVSQFESQFGTIPIPRE